MVGDDEVAVDEPRLVRRIDERGDDHDLIDMGGEDVEPCFAAGNQADERALAGKDAVDDAFALSDLIELDPIADGDLVPERIRGVVEQTPPKVALQNPRSPRSVGADRDFLSQDLDDGSNERRRERFHGEEASML
jgi:hypothetical protein